MKFNRLNDMEQYILLSGTSSLEELCRHYHVSMSTVRRDITELIRRNRIIKVYGGVTRNRAHDALQYNAPFQANPAHAKSKIGACAASFVKDGMSIFVDSGTPGLELLSCLSEKQNITVISHNLSVLSLASQFPNLNVIALGGIYNSETSSFSGKSALEELSKMSIDLVFLKSDGVTIERGLTSSSYSEIEVKKNVAQWNRDIILLMDGAEFGRNALMTFCEIGRLRAIICDAPAPNEFRYANALRRITFLSAQEEDHAIARLNDLSLPKLQTV